MKNKKIKSNVFDVLNQFNIDDIDLTEEEVPEAKPTTKKDRRGRPKKKNLIRDSGAQKGLPKSLTRKTYIIRTELVEKIETYADKTDMTIKDALNELLEEALGDKDI